MLWCQQAIISMKLVSYAKLSLILLGQTGYKELHIPANSMGEVDINIKHICDISNLDEVPQVPEG